MFYLSLSQGGLPPGDALLGWAEGAGEAPQAQWSGGGAHADLMAKGADLPPPPVSSLASPHRPLASDGSLEPQRREYL